jgi:hypothetical protein
MLSRVAAYVPKRLMISITKVTSAVSNGASPKTNATVRRGKGRPLLRLRDFDCPRFRLRLPNVAIGVLPLHRLTPCAPACALVKGWGGKRVTLINIDRA